jgi:predicted permease
MWLAPSDVRARHGADMIATFADLADVAAATGWWAVARLVAHEARDLVVARRLTGSRASRHERTTVMSLLRTLFDWRTLGQTTRALWRRPVFALTAVLTLAIGTASTTALFSVVDTVVVRPLPYPDPDRLVTVMEASRSATSKTSLVAPARIADWQRMSQAFASVSGLYSENITETSGTDAERLAALRVTPRYFAVFGATPLLGRTFTSDEETFGGPAAVVISEAFWTRRFGRDPGVIRRTLRIGTTVYPIVGVLPATFSNSTVAVWIPAPLTPSLAQARDARFLSGVGRLKPGVTIPQAQDDLDRVQRELAVRFPATDKDWSAQVVDLKAARVGDRPASLWLLFGAVGVLWLIALANVAALVLVEMRRRERELSVRSALGASRGQIIGRTLQEVAVLAITAGVLGAAASTWMVGAIRSTFTTLPRMNELHVDGTALAFAALTIVAAALLCGACPAWLSTRRLDVGVARGGRGIAGGHRVQRGLVVTQVALGVCLCASAMLPVRSYDNLTRVDTGFAPDGAYTFHVGARWDEDRTAVGHFQERLLIEMARQPGVQAIGFANFLPLPGATIRYQVKVSGVAGTDPNGFVTVGSRTVAGGYFNALKIPVVAGSACPAFRFDPGATPKILVNERFVERFAPGQNLVGRELRFQQYQQTAQTIVGIVANVAEDGPANDAVPYTYACAGPGNWPDPEYVVRLTSAEGFAGRLRTIVREIDPTRAVFGYESIADSLHTATDEPRMNAGLTALFAVTALGLAGIGLYGLFMLMVSESRREIGVRLALGAAPRQMISLVFASAGRLLAAGLFLGLALTAGTGRVLRTMLFGISTHDVASLIGSTVMLVAIACLAIALPAVRASRVPPTEALRGD